MLLTPEVNLPPQDRRQIMLPFSLPLADDATPCGRQLSPACWICNLQSTLQRLASMRPRAFAVGK